MKISVLVPCYNEINTIDEILFRINNASEKIEEIIIVDDCSNDGTTEKLEKINKDNSNIKVFYHNLNQGKGAALRTGLKEIKGDLVIIQDADLEYDPNEYTKLIKPIAEGKADVVYGSRFAGNSERRVMYFWTTLANKYLTVFSNIFTNLNLTDMETCYKVFKKNIINQITIEENRFGFEPEITAKISKLNCVIYEVGISYHGRTYNEGKKIGFRDGVRAIYAIIKYNLF